VAEAGEDHALQGCLQSVTGSLKLELRGQRIIIEGQRFIMASFKFEVSGKGSGEASSKRRRYSSDWEEIPQEMSQEEQWEEVSPWMWEQWKNEAMAAGDGGSFGGGCENHGGTSGVVDQQVAHGGSSGVVHKKVVQPIVWHHLLESRAQDLASQEDVVLFQMKTLSELRSYLDKSREDLKVREAQLSQIVEERINERLLVIQMSEKKNTNARLVADRRREDIWERQRGHEGEKLVREKIALHQSRKGLELQWGAIAMKEDAVQMREDEVQSREDEVQRREDKVQMREEVLRNIFGH
jgi:hypothetical protein